MSGCSQAPKQNGKGPKDQLSAQCKYCGKRHERKIALHTEKPALHVENPTTLQQCFKNSRKFKNLEGLEGIYKVADDILIAGRGTTKDEAVKNHDADLQKLLERWQERNLKLNREKLQLKCTETPFIGHMLMPEGIKPDPRKVEAVLKMERPSDVAAV